MNISAGAHIHLMGICGTAMASLAGLLQGQGYKVTGSDSNVYPPMSTQLEELGIPIKEGYKKENLNPKPDLVVVGNVITRKHEEAVALLESDIPYTSLPKAMGEFAISDRSSIVVSGTHGKTTTTSIMTWVADKCGIEAGYLIGGIPENYSRSFRAAKDPWFVIEGDEYDTAFFDKVPKFIYYRPKYVILTSVEFDHADIYSSLDDIMAAFTQLVELIPEEGLLVCNADDPDVMTLAQKARCKVVTYGLEAGDYQAVSRSIEVGRNQFAVARGSERIADIAIKLFGPHNTLNTLAAFAMASELGWKPHKILQGLAEFKGVKRRQEIIGEPNGITLIEDFAHHPTAVDLTIQTMKEKYPDRKLFAVFEPRSATSRRKVFQQDYAKAFRQADEVVIAGAYDQSKIAEEDRFSVPELVASLQGGGVTATAVEEVEAIVDHLKQRAQRNDVVLLMSNGGFGGIYSKLLAEL